jgi:hypothetical protein
MKDNFKYFNYNINNFTGYRRIVEKSNFKVFSKLKYDGFEIVSIFGGHFTFK